MFDESLAKLGQESDSDLKQWMTDNLPKDTLDSGHSEGDLTVGSFGNIGQLLERQESILRESSR